MKLAGRRRDAWLALLAGLVAFALYLRTLYPGLNGIGDTPKFQYLGRILGTSHPPGYPIHLLLSAVFARLPFGNPAWRANLLSAVCASAAVALLYLLARRLGARPLVAMATALAFGCGRVLWSQATLAEVYALAATLLAALLLTLVSWGESRAPRSLDLAVLLAGLSLAHHTTVAMVAPALILYVLATDRRAGLAPPFLGRAVLLVLLGLSPYLLIVQRTRAGAPYLGAHARNLTELWDVMRGAAFEGRLFPFGAGTVLTERVPLVWGLLASELTLAGALLALVGLGVLAWRRPREALLLGLAALGLVVFALNYDVPDLDVFLVPAFVPLFALAGAGAEALVARGRRAAPALAALALAWPGVQLARNFKANDHSDRSFEMRYFASLFEALPARAAIAAESYTVDQMVLYELFGAQAAAGRDVITAPADAESVEKTAARGYTVFAFERTRAALEALGYAFAPVRLLDAPLADYKKTMARDWLVVEAGVSPEGRYASIAPAAASAPVTASPGSGVTVEFEAGEAIGASGVKAPVGLRAESLPVGAAVTVDGVEAARSERGIAFAATSRNGKLAEAHDLDPDEGLRVPFTARAFPFFRLVFPRQCAEAGAGDWVDATREASRGRLRLRIDDFETYDARLVLWLGSARALEPRLARALGKGTPVLESASFAGASAARAAMAADALDPAPFAASPVITRAELRVNDDGDFATVALDLAGLPAVARVRADVDRKSPVRALACAATPGDADFFGPASASRVSLRFDGDVAAFLAGGWNAPEREGFRWSAARDARLLLPLASVAPTRVRVRVRPLAIPGTPMTLALAVGDLALAPLPLASGWGYYEWDVPAAAWRVGTNELTFRGAAVAVPQAIGLGADTRSLGIAFSSLQLRRDP